MRVVYDVNVCVSTEFSAGCVCYFTAMPLNWESGLKKRCESCTNVLKAPIFFESQKSMRKPEMLVLLQGQTLLMHTFNSYVNVIEIFNCCKRHHFQVTFLIGKDRGFLSTVKKFLNNLVNFFESTIWIIHLFLSISMRYFSVLYTHYSNNFSVSVKSYISCGKFCR